MGNSNQGLGQTGVNQVLVNLLAKSRQPFSEDDMLIYGEQVFENCLPSDTNGLANWCLANNICTSNATKYLTSELNKKESFSILVLDLACYTNVWESLLVK